MKIPTQPNKWNDPNWCMQFMAPVFGIAFLLIGSATASGFWVNFKQYSYIYFGILWLFIGFIHRQRWNHKQKLKQALEAVRDAPVKRVEEV